MMRFLPCQDLAMPRSPFSGLHATLARLGRPLARLAGDGSAARLRRRYRLAVDALPKDQRQVFLLHRVENLSISEIADRLGITTVQVERLLSDGLYAISCAVDRR
jgi:DNA-directed RNA polymerase specialized sigma24 family protein